MASLLLLLVLLQNLLGNVFHPSRETSFRTCFLIQSIKVPTIRHPKTVNSIVTKENTGATLATVLTKEYQAQNGADPEGNGSPSSPTEMVVLSIERLHDEVE